MNADWKIVTPSSHGHSRLDMPLVSIRGQQLFFNASFCDKAKIKEKVAVRVYVEENDRQLGFEFLDQLIKGTHALTRDGGSTNPKVDRGGRLINAAKLINHNNWISSIAKSKDPNSKCFEPTLDLGRRIWMINLCPSFECRVGAIIQIPKGTAGIYRYVRNDGEIVYIGKGQIKSRATSPERKDWDFDYIEYSIVNDESMQLKWEAWWLDKFVSEYGKIPFYNKIQGHSRKNSVNIQ